MFELEVRGARLPVGTVRGVQKDESVIQRENRTFDRLRVLVVARGEHVFHARVNRFGDRARNDVERKRVAHVDDRKRVVHDVPHDRRGNTGLGGSDPDVLRGERKE